MSSNALMPQTYAELERWAHKAAATEWVPREYRGKPDSVMIAAQYAVEIGMGIIEGLRSIAVINGKPSLYGDGLLALCQASTVCEYINETPILDGAGNVTGYICEAKRRGQDAKQSRFTIDDAKRSQLWGKSGPWQQYPQRMLQMRARGFALRDAFADVLKGLISREEAEDYPPIVDVKPHNSGSQNLTLENQGLKEAVAASGLNTEEEVEEEGPKSKADIIIDIMNNNCPDKTALQTYAQSLKGKVGDISPEDYQRVQTHYQTLLGQFRRMEKQQ